MKTNLIVVSFMGAAVYAISSRIANAFFLKEDWLLEVEKTLHDRSRSTMSLSVSASQIQTLKAQNDFIFYGGYGFISGAAFRYLCNRMVYRLKRKGTFAPRLILTSVSFIPFYIITGLAFNEKPIQIFRRLARDYLAQSLPLTLLCVSETYAMFFIAKYARKSAMNFSVILAIGLLFYTVSTVHMMTLCRPEYRNFLKS